MFDKSTDGGVSFGFDKKVAGLHAGWNFYDESLRKATVPGIYRVNGFPVTGCDISNSPYRGNVYVNWSDQVDGDTDIYFAKSTNGGNTWSTPKKVNNDLLRRHQFFNWMNVDPKTGKIYIIFYDRRDNQDANSLQTSVYIARSTDGGETFHNYKISESPFSPNADIFFGDYINISAYDGKIHPIWMRLDGNTMSLWTAPINDSQLTEVKENPEQIITSYNLFQNYPNPFNLSTIINYQIPEETFVRLKVYDLLGKEIATLVNENKKSGSYNVIFNPVNLNSGLYLYRLEAAANSGTAKEFTYSKKMILVK